jgi:4-alpha-glucanotransferase
MGVGEFRDLLEFVDFNVDIGSSMIQLLPINDTRCSNTWRDSYPYRYHAIGLLVVDL